MVQIGVTSDLSKAVSAENLCSELSLLKVGDFKSRWRNDSCEDPTLDDIRSCVDGSGSGVSNGRRKVGKEFSFSGDVEGGASSLPDLSKTASSLQTKTPRL